MASRAIRPIVPATLGDALHPGVTLTDAMARIEALRQAIIAAIPDVQHVELVLAGPLDGPADGLVLSATLKPFVDPQYGKFVLQSQPILGVHFGNIAARVALDSTSKHVIRALVTGS